MSLSPKERLLGVLKKEKVDRPPVICTGGMMNAAIVDVMERRGHTLPEGHHDTAVMVDLSRDIHEETGFENLGIPFCMTVEAEVLGSAIDFGSLSCEPKIAREAFSSVRDVEYRDPKMLLRSGRVGKLAEAASVIKRNHPDVPLIASITGPVSTAASIVDPMQFLRELRKEREESHKVHDYVASFLSAFAAVMVEAGADAVCIGDPTATGEILGPSAFEEYAVRYLNMVIDAIHEAGVPVIVHICGDMRRVKGLIPALRCDAISTDAMVNLRLLKEEFPSVTTMGNVSTYLLESGEPEKVVCQTEQLVRDGINIISPACGLSTSTSLHNIRTLTGVVKGA